MVRCLSEVFQAIQGSPQNSVLLAAPGGTVVCVASQECVEHALRLLPSGISVLGKFYLIDYLREFSRLFYLPTCWV